MIIKNSPRRHLHPVTQPCKYDFTFDQKTIWLKKTPLDFTCIQWFNLANTTSPSTKGPYDYKENSPRRHLHPMNQPCKYDFALDQRPYDYKLLAVSSLASNDSTLQIRLSHKPKGRIIIKNFLGLHMHPMSQPYKYDFVLDPSPIWLYKTFPATSYYCLCPSRFKAQNFTLLCLG